MGSIKIWHVAIPVSDLDQAVRFYCSFLGFDLLGYDDYPTKRQAFVSVESGGFNIELFEPKEDQAQKLKFKPDHLAFEVEDINAFRTDLLARAHGREIPQLIEFDNGVKCLELKDPDGLSVELFQGRRIYEAYLAERTQEAACGTH